MSRIRTDWTRPEVESIFGQPLLELVFQAASVHRKHHDPRELQLCTLLSIKTGGCPENCAYCPQSAHYRTGVKAEKLMSLDVVLEAARKAKESGSSRFCLGAAWREVRNSPDFDRVLEMVASIKEMGMEVCCTLGMLSAEQAQKLKEAGLWAYNHNLDSGAEFYEKIISTRKYQDRLDTLQNVRKAGITVCCGGIVGMGESDSDRISFLHTLSTLPSHPESVPVNALLAMPGTPLEKQTKPPIWDMLRVIAAARILMPSAMVRLSAGRVDMTFAEQA